jgi:hypothetical protein
VQFEATHHRLPGSVTTLRTDVRRIVLTDEPVVFRFTLCARESRDLTAVVLQELDPVGWQTSRKIWTRGAPSTGAVEFRLGRGVTAIRCRLDQLRTPPEFTDPLMVDVRSAPPVLILLSMGGWWGGSPPAPSGLPDAQATHAILEQHHITVGEDECRLRGIPSDLIRSLTTNRNIECNDLCDEGCINFLEHLALRLMNEEGLANQLKSISGSGYCHERTNDKGLDNRIILGKWENSELEPVRPPGTRTWEDILDTYRSLGHHHVILVGQSLGGAKFAGMIRDHWRWGNDLKVALFVSWDSTDLGGGVSSVGDRPKTVLAFFQTDNVWWQTGKHIDQATEEHDLTKLFSHDAIARSCFVHDKTVMFIREAIHSIRGTARGGNSATFRIRGDGSLGERVEVGRPHRNPAISVARGFELDGADYLCLVRKRPGLFEIWGIDEHGLLSRMANIASISPDFTSAAFFTISGLTFVLLVKRDAGIIDAESLIMQVRPEGLVGSKRYPDTLGGPWDHAEAFRINNIQFVCVARSTGDIRIVRVDAGGMPTSIVPGPLFGFGQLLSITYYHFGPSTYLFTLGSEGMSTFRVNQDGSIGQRIWHEAAAPFGPLGYSTAAHLRVGSDHSLLLLDSVGKMQIRRVNADGSIAQTLFQGNTRLSRALLTTYETAGNGYAFLVQRAF